MRRWDAGLSRDVLAHWLDLMSASGWIPREQILGAEAAVRVPVEYITQKVRALLSCQLLAGASQRVSDLLCCATAASSVAVDVIAARSQAHLLS